MFLDPPPYDWARHAAWLARRYPDVPTIDPEALLAWLDDPTRQPPLLLDIRSAGEQAISTLPGARCVRNAADARRAVRETPPRQVVVYCAAGVRSARLARTLRRDGIRALNLVESIFGWANRGYPLVAQGVPTHRVHPYDAKWATLLSAERRAAVID
jgi:rhodanese-related sulfurtransferase